MGRSHDRSTRRLLLSSGLTLAGAGLLAGCGTRLPGLPASRPQARIGLLTPGSLTPSPSASAFDEAMRDLGWVQGENLRVEYRWSTEPERQAPAAAELVASGVQLIVAAGNQLIRAAKDASPSTPVVMAVSSDPVGSGLVAGLARPGGRVTGLTTLGPELSTKRLELLKEVLPRLSRLAAIWNPKVAERLAEERALQAAADSLGIEIRVLSAQFRAGAFNAVVEAARAWPADALMLLDDPLYPPLLVIFEAELPKWPLPTIGVYGDFAHAGGLLAHGPSLPRMFARAATYVDRILRGASPADLPVEQPTEFDTVVNLKTAEALGLSVPRSILEQATAVIQ